MRARGVGEAVGPLAQERLDQRLGLAVRPRASRDACSGARSRVAAQSVAPEVRVVGLRRCPRARARSTIPCSPIPGERAARGRPRSASPSSLAQHLAVGEPRVVVDRDVQELPAGPGAVDAVLEDRACRLPEAAELLRVDVQELARPLALVADARITAGPGKARAAQLAAAPCRRSKADARRTAATTSGPACGRRAQRERSPASASGAEPPRLPLRHRGAVDERRPSHPAR